MIRGGAKQELVIFYTALIPKAGKPKAREKIVLWLQKLPMKVARGASRWLLLMSLAAVPALAAPVSDLYEVTVPATANRDAAFLEALKTVVVRASGRRDAATRLGAALNNPRQYVQRFGSPTDDSLQVAFDSISIEHLLGQAGLPIWGRERPATLVLLSLAGPTGTTNWVDVTSGAAERDAIAKAASQRGLPLVWPDSPEYGQLGDEPAAAALLQTAARYDADAVLLGRGRSDGAGGATVRWTLASPEGTAETTGALDAGVQLAADTFARVYAASGSAVDDVQVEVSGIKDLDAYASTLNYLEGMTLVRGVTLEQVQGETMQLRLTVRGGANVLRRTLALGGKLVPQSADEASADHRLRLRYQP